MLRQLLRLYGVSCGRGREIGTCILLTKHLCRPLHDGICKIKKDIFMCPFFIFVFSKKVEYAILKIESLQRDRVKLCQEKALRRMPIDRNGYNG